MVDFNRYCSVIFMFEDEKKEIVFFKYERSRDIDDFTLTKEAKVNAKDMVKKEIEGTKELIGIGIARSEKQYQEMTKKSSDDLL